MGKKRSRATQTSKGERRSVANGLGDDRSELKKMIDKMDAFRKGKNVMLTIPNPNKQATREPFIRVSAKEKWRNDKFIMKQTS
jgi:hypothetical protein|tara:strand:+ start:233 stop:481 length:249 start_codon:yes stop_codon:yes gene_type:complete